MLSFYDWNDNNTKSSQEHDVWLLSGKDCHFVKHVLRISDRFLRGGVARYRS